MKISKIILPIVLLIACSLPSLAQTKYEYAVITYYPYGRELEISINGLEYKKIEVEKNEVKGYGDVNRALVEVNKMSEDRWSIFESNTAKAGTGKIYTFFLRREKE